MALGGSENDFATLDQEEKETHGHRDMVSLWIDNISLEEGSDGLPSRSEIESPGRDDGHALMARRVTHTLSTQIHKGPARGPVPHDQPIIPTHCYRLLRDGVVVVAKGHPFACACSWNERARAGEGDYVPPLLAYTSLHAPVEHLDQRQKFLNIVMSCCAEMSYPLDRYGLMSHNPFRQGERRDFLTFTPLALEPVLTVGAVIDLMQHRNTGKSAIRHNITYICQMIDEALAPSNSIERTATERRLVLQAFTCLTIVSVSKRASTWVAWGLLD
jgi:hypothetical protein